MKKNTIGILLIILTVFIIFTISQGKKEAGYYFTNKQIAQQYCDGIGGQLYKNSETDWCVLNPVGCPNQCADDGYSFWSSCTSGEPEPVCTGQDDCTGPTADNGQYTCNDRTIFRCNNGWGAYETCPSGSECEVNDLVANSPNNLCTEATCTNPVADPGKYACRSGDVDVCQGGTWSKIDDCNDYGKDDSCTVTIARSTETAASNDCRTSEYVYYCTQNNVREIYQGADVVHTWCGAGYTCKTSDRFTYSTRQDSAAEYEALRNLLCEEEVQGECTVGDSQTCDIGGCTGTQNCVDLNVPTWGYCTTTEYCCDGIPDWQCTQWSNLTGQCGTRSCVDAAQCGDNTNKPITSKSCGAPTCTEDWSCGSWSNTTGQCGTRTCTDDNDCGTTSSKPTTSKSCTTTPSACLSLIQEDDGQGGCKTTTIAWLFIGLIVLVVVSKGLGGKK